MNFKKIIAAVAASAIMLSTMAFSASAAEPVSMIMYAKGDPSWVDVITTVDLNGDGDYSVTLDVSEDGSNEWGYFMADYTQSAPEEYKGATVTVKSFKINGVEYPLAKDSMTLVGDDGTFMFQIFNVWNEANNMLPAENLKMVGQLYGLLDADGNKIKVENFSCDFTVSGVGGAAAATTAPATGNVPVIVLGSVMALAVIGAVASRKRK
ncbi:MAG: hypothetical protein LBM59_00425 [Ruminococcus sp.]|nr:hypothetical protein [Ruminococcus sp.]